MRRVRIKLDQKIKLQFTKYDKIIAMDLLDIVFKDPKVTKKKENVMRSLDNCLYDGMSVKEAYYDTATNEIELHLTEYRICPKCGRGYDEYPAISRKDNKTEICPTCGEEEALLDFYNAQNNG